MYSSNSLALVTSEFGNNIDKKRMTERYVNFVRLFTSTESYTQERVVKGRGHTADCLCMCTKLAYG